MTVPHQTEQMDSREVNQIGFNLLTLLFFPASFLYHELLLRCFDVTHALFSIDLLPILLFCLASGLFVTLILNLIPKCRAMTILIGTLQFLWTAYVCIAYCCKSFFKTYFGLSYIFHMSGQVVGDFKQTLFDVISDRIPFILLALIPFLLYLVFHKYIDVSDHPEKYVVIVEIILMLLFQVGGCMIGHFGPYANTYTYEFSCDSSIPHYGLVGAARLELEYAVLGMPEPELVQYEPEEIIEEVIEETEQVPETSEKTQIINYGYNSTDIDFSSLIDQTSNNTLINMHKYFSTRIPSKQNKYTDMFKGKNLIEITAESFSPYVISEELTPTLYKLTHEGFVFNNYYQPGWGQSTTGGEFAVMTGLIPTWINSNLSFGVSAHDSMPFALGNQFKKIGYATRAYHDNSYSYYGRDTTHPNLGYDYKGFGNGLVMETGSNTGWPASDLEMMQVTVDEYINDYLASGIPFHTYYMGVSGHAFWGWGNAMSAKNREVAVAAFPDAPQCIQGYIAANLEIEYALSYLIDRLDEAGILDDTVIALTADHYPYALVNSETGVDYYNELRGFSDTENDISRYKNTFILYCSSMEAPVVVDTPCSAIDILPTISNLFGLEYDSRLLSGRDIFATNYIKDSVSSSMPLVILPTSFGMSWITTAGTYDSTTKTFTPNDGITVNDTYVKDVAEICNAKFNFARYIIQYDYYSIVYPDPAL